MRKQIRNNVSWVGKTDWSLRLFHGYEYTTHRGSSYNSYLVQEEKSALIDTVWMPYAKEYVANLAQEIDLKKIDYIIANHGEVDHSGSLPELLSHIPGTPVYCTANCVKSLKGQYHQEWNFQVVKTGDKLPLGNGKELVFVEAPMLHWPDSMMSYLTGDNILFSNDAFGQHYASEHLFNDQVDRAELYAEARKYYANILTPFSHLVTKKIQEFLAFKLPLDMICTSHGIIWRDHPAQIVEQYLQWADAYKENQVTIVYDTMWNGTRRLAEKAAEGLTAADPSLTVKVYNLPASDMNDVVTEIFRSKALLLGSPTINRSYLHSLAALLDMCKGLGFKGKKAAAFGCHGWSGESVKLLTEHLKHAGFETVDDGLRATWTPDDKVLADTVAWGKALAGKL